MFEEYKHAIRSQCGAAIKTLENAVESCPDDLWGEEISETAFWYRVYHTIFWLDLYLTASPDFTPPPPYTLSELDPAGVMPDRVYSKDELLSYLDYSRKKLLQQMDNFSEDDFQRRFKSSWMDFSIAELMLYNMRHVQHHAAQLNLILREETGNGQRWVGKSDL